MGRTSTYWLPRGLGIAFVAFLALFALDVFGEYRGFEVLLALFMHLIPCFALGGALWLSWKRPLYGGIAYLALGVAFTVFFQTYQDFVVFLLISFPVLVAGGLFLREGLRER